MLRCCHQYFGGVFKVALYDRWLVVISGRKLIDELRKRPDDEVSSLGAVEEACLNDVVSWIFLTLLLSGFQLQVLCREASHRGSISC